MSAATIGTGAVILTANADKLLTGLDKAKSATNKWADNTEHQAITAAHAIESAQQGAFKRLAVKGLTGANYSGGVDYLRQEKEMKDAEEGAKKAAKASEDRAKKLKLLLLGAAALGVYAVKKTLERFAEIGDRAQRYSNVSPTMGAGVQRTQTAMDRWSGALDEFLFRIADELNPYLEKAASVLEVIGRVGAEVFGEAVNLIGEVVTSIAQWVDETFGLATATTSAGTRRSQCCAPSEPAWRMCGTR
jgi:hypothetical protein